MGQAHLQTAPHPLRIEPTIVVDEGHEFVAGFLDSALFRVTQSQARFEDNPQWDMRPCGPAPPRHRAGIVGRGIVDHDNLPINVTTDVLAGEMVEYGRQPRRAVIGADHHRDATRRRGPSAAGTVRFDLHPPLTGSRTLSTAG